MKPVLGKATDGISKVEGADVRIDIERLIETRLVLTAISGGGKSHAIRRILEQTHGQVQQIVIDPEGEFYTLREKFPYVLAGQNGDCPADPHKADSLALRLLELRVSCIIDLYELNPDGRVLFVKNFIDALLNAPKNLRHPCMVVLDEAHAFAPEKGEGEAASRNSVITLMAQARKRLLCPILATQRLSKLDKNAISEAHNMMIGKSTLDIDVARAMRYLGIGRKDEQLIRGLHKGHFYTFGPAFSDEVMEVFVGPTVTESPRLGSRMTAPTAAPAEIQRILAQLAEPGESEKKLATEKELRAEVSTLRKQLASKASIAAPVPSPSKAVSQEKLIAAYERGVKAERKRIRGEIVGTLKLAKREIDDALPLNVEIRCGADRSHTIKNLGSGAVEAINLAIAAVDKALPVQPEEIERPPILPRALLDRQAPKIPPRSARSVSQRPPSANNGNVKLPPGERAVLTACATYPEGCERNRLRVLTGYRRSSRDAYIQRLREKGYVEDGPIITATPEGIAALGDFEPLPTGSALQEYWEHKLPDGEAKILALLIAAAGEPLQRDSLDEPTGYARSSRDAYIQRLKARGLVEVLPRGEVRADRNLFD